MPPDVARDTSSKVIGISVFNPPSKITRGEVRVKAAITNAGAVYIGYRSDVKAGTSSTKDGYPLYAGQEITFRILDLAEFRLIADAEDQKIFWIIP